MTELAYADELELKGEGFPALFQKAFLRTADALQTVVLCRAPGPTTTGIIAENYDLKAYFVKAKSSDWGPMQGFLCRVPILGKKGLDGIEYNTNELLGYCKVFADRGNPPSEVNVGTPELTLDQRISKLLQAAGLQDIDFISPAARLNLTKKSLADLRSVLALPKADIYGALLRPTTPASATRAVRKKLDAALKELALLAASRSPFLPLVISADRFKEIQARSSMPEGFRVKVGSNFYGIAFHERENAQAKVIDVVMDYLVRKVDARWELYFGEIWYRDYGVDGSGKKLTEPAQWKCFPHDIELSLLPGFDAKQKADPAIKAEFDPAGPRLLWPTAAERQDVPFKPAELAAMAALREKFRSQQLGAAAQGTKPFSDPPTGAMSPLQGLQNFYPPYADKDSHKNAVTGDFDLFAVWPGAGVDLGALQRQSEERFAAGTPERERPLFHRVFGKPFALQSTFSPHVHIEFIPGFDGIEALEHSSFGNFSSHGLLCAGILNSHVAGARRKLGKSSPNAAFHSDEGGRPGISNVEYPVAVFLPEAVAKALDAKAGKRRVLIRDHQRFLDLILALKGDCLVPLHFVWLHDMLNFAYRRGPYAGNKVSAADAEAVRNQLAWLLTGTSQRLDGLSETFVALFEAQHLARPSADKVSFVMDGQWPPAQP